MLAPNPWHPPERDELPDDRNYKPEMVVVYLLGVFAVALVIAVVMIVWHATH
jgi:hypothetical protein